MPALLCHPVPHTARYRCSWAVAACQQTRKRYKPGYDRHEWHSTATDTLIFSQRSLVLGEAHACAAQSAVPSGASQCRKPLLTGGCALSADQKNGTKHQQTTELSLKIIA